MAARICEISFTKNLESEFCFIKNPNLIENKKFVRVGGEGVGCG